ncbi:MAG TPA: VOC family protein [Marinagarivorans sp.]|nr:VOC family protein [Cellvibrionaceae bacterium]HMY39439.1 VOC family protein [Marinagarivorans sp.]HNG61931.1 VOC family protein [Cellvibrionaceae bacterium]
MKSLSPYIIFFGRTREALEFYQQALKGEVVNIMKFADGGSACAEMAADPEGVMHSEFRAEDVHFFASDGIPGSSPINGNRITLAINFSHLDEQAAVFNALAEGGEVTQPLADQFWGAKYGELIDKFGLHWSLNCFTAPAHT